jgi:hypothetical protein
VHKQPWLAIPLEREDHPAFRELEQAVREVVVASRRYIAAPNVVSTCSARPPIVHGRGYDRFSASHPVNPPLSGEQVYILDGTRQCLGVIPASGH